MPSKSGFSGVTGSDSVVFADNVNFTGTWPPTPEVTLNGQLLIGSNVSPHIRVGTLTSSDASITITNGPGTIDLKATGSVVMETLTPDSGGAVSPVGGTIPTLGQQALTTATVETYNDGAGNFRIADQTWQSQYVVDASTTPGLKGTFTTIQSAINQAVADGVASLATTATIYIRPGTYSEDIVLPALKRLRLAGIGPDLSSAAGATVGPIINGNTTFAANAVPSFENLNFSAASGDAVVVTGTANSPLFLNCLFQSTITINNPGAEFRDCQFQADQTITAAASIFTECYFNTSTTNISGSGSSALRFFNCSQLSITLSDPGSFIAYNCYAGFSVDGTSSSVSTLVDCQGAITATASFNFSGMSRNGAVAPFSSAVTPLLFPTYIGNLYQAIRPAVGDFPYSILTTDFYIGVTTTESARTVTLPSANVVTNQTFLIKDESGGALINNITINVSGGIKTIDGATSQLINTNYGAIGVIYDGTNYFII